MNLDDPRLKKLSPEQRARFEQVVTRIQQQKTSDRPDDLPTYDYAGAEQSGWSFRTWLIIIFTIAMVALALLRLRG